MATLLENRVNKQSRERGQMNATDAARYRLPQAVLTACWAAADRSTAQNELSSFAAAASFGAEALGLICFFR